MSEFGGSSVARGASTRRFVGWAAGVAIGVFSLAGASSALANHYHDCCGFPWATGHALVHGGSTGDQVWHGRSTANNVLATRHCAAGSQGAGTKGQTLAGSQSTCEIQVSRNYFIANDTECLAWGYENKDYGGSGLPGNSPHFHNAHNPCGGIEV